MKISDDIEFENIKRRMILKGVNSHLIFDGTYAYRFAQWLILMDYERQLRIPIDFTFEVKCEDVKDRLLIETTLNNYLLFDIYPFR